MTSNPTATSLNLAAPKLRSSCDNCGISKVKCNRERPRCGRCASTGLTCVYGPSQKHGKPPRKRIASASISREAKRVCNASTLSQYRDDIASIGKADHPEHAFSQGNVSFALPGSEGVMGIDQESQDLLNDDFFPALSFQEWPQIEDLDQIGHWHQSGAWQQPGHSSTTLDLPSAYPSVPTQVVRKSTEESHSCARDSYEIFRDLICPSPALHAPESNSVTVSAQLDHVLQFNKTAIKKLSKVLKCPCAKSGHRAMVHASIISRILIWYQQAAGWTGSSSWGPRPPTLLDSSDSSSTASSPRPPSNTDDDSPHIPSLVQSTGFAVEHTPMKIGTYSIEDQNMQGAFRNQLVLSELKRASQLIDVFSSISPDGNSLAYALGGLYSHLGIWLRGEYSRTVTILKSRLKTLNENLGS